ncbi:hypothetical protein [Tahibacter sp.]|uniref:hypothetical protein n=1 Tax=Tahibacter sp. TaxID=2056211 RepID=UPI0028C383AB|nr:hypothetical protein [Tahibacter sp.]
MSDDKTKQDGLKSFVPESVSFLRAAVSSIPVIGSALDHLLFDKADAIRIRNIETLMNSTADRVREISEEKLNKDWFSSEEALSAFRLLSERASFEPDKQKIRDLAHLGVTCGSKEHSSDPMKLLILEHLSHLTSIQLRLLQIVASTPVKKGETRSETVVQHVDARWANDIAAELKKGPSFWTGTLDVIAHLEVLEALNLLRTAPISFNGQPGFSLTRLGELAANFATIADLEKAATNVKSSS